MVLSNSTVAATFDQDLLLCRPLRWFIREENVAIEAGRKSSFFYWSSKNKRYFGSRMVTDRRKALNQLLRRFRQAFGNF